MGDNERGSQAARSLGHQSAEMISMGAWSASSRAEAGLAGGGGAGDDEEERALGFRMFERQGPLSRLSEVFKSLEHTREAAGAALLDDVRRDSWGRMCKSGSVIQTGEMRDERGGMGDK